MKPWNKPIRVHAGRETKKFDEENERIAKDIAARYVIPYDKPKKNKSYGVTNWMVGTCTYPWSPWVQIHFGYFSIQIKWYLIVAAMVVGSFFLGKAI